MTDLLDQAKQHAKKSNPLHQPKAASSTQPSMAPTVVTEPASAEQHGSTTKPEEGDISEFKVNPEHPPVNKPFGSTGEVEQDVDISHPPKSNDDI